MDDKRAGGRRIVGFALAASAVVLLLMASLVYTGTFGVAGESRAVVAGAMAVAAALDVVLAIYFVVSDPS